MVVVEVPAGVWPMITGNICMVILHMMMMMMTMSTGNIMVAIMVTVLSINSLLPYHD